MSVKIAVATSDGENVDLHFGKADSLLIFELEEQGGTKTFVQKEARSVPAETSLEASAAQPCGTGAGGFSGGCGSGDGGRCANCHGGGGCCGGRGNISLRVEKFLDCRAIVAAQIGGNMRRQFERSAISCFDVELPVKEALEKLAAYYTKFE